MAESPVTVPVHCRRCNEEVALLVMGLPIGAPAGPALRPAIWTCPHCGDTNKGALPGRLVGLNRFQFVPERIR